MGLFISIGSLARLVAYYGIVRHLPDSTLPGGALFRRIRYLVCRPLFRACGRNVNMERGAYIGEAGTISIGNNSGIGIRASVGRCTTIGSNVMMGPEVLILTTNHRTDSIERPMNQQGHQSAAAVTIENDVWIGARAIILAGVRIGAGSIVGAGAVVPKSIPPGVIAVGNPARVVRQRHQLTPQ
ncbi:MAG TPA: DapH/DapD/GlmU-related protein [Bryobacteraceae bacterium]|jgi:maltose O-acetyltransferase|nr:DapH/DapD/GlmU-related protein [Bryobacteraceae bacterium]